MPTEYLIVYRTELHQVITTRWQDTLRALARDRASLKRAHLEQHHSSFSRGVGDTKADVLYRISGRGLALIHGDAALGDSTRGLGSFHIITALEIHQSIKGGENEKAQTVTFRITLFALKLSTS